MRLKPHEIIFLSATLLVLLAGGFFLLTFSKAEIHLAINGFHSPFFDAFFTRITYLGEGWMFFLALPLFFLKSWRAGIEVALAGLFTGIIAGVFKNILFQGAPRPIEYFSNLTELYFVPGVEIHHWNSFPSGHTMTAFALFFTLSILYKNRLLSFIFFVLALLVGISRMYLSQHFLVDVTAGAVLGMCAAFLARFIAQKLPWLVLDKKVFNS